MFCSICQREFDKEICSNPFTMSHGNNAQPVNDGRCCDVCDKTIVIPARLVRLGQGQSLRIVRRIYHEETK